MKKDRHHPDPHSHRAGFTLLEIVVAITIGASLILAAVTFAFSMGELWGNGSETRLFDRHVRGVSRFLDELMRHAQPPPEEPGSVVDQQAQRATPSESTTIVAWRKPAGREFGGEELLSFELEESPGVFAWPEEPLPFVVCSLRVDPGRGLFLLWKSRLEIDYLDEAPREQLVSPFVTRMEYLYYDTDGANPDWEITERPRTQRGGERDVPTRVRLTFDYEGDERTTDLVLPGTARGVPVY